MKVSDSLPSFAIACSLAFSLVFSLNTNAQYPDFPLKVSSNSRYLMDQQGQPFFYHADTPWMLASNLSVEDAKEYISIRKKQGFNTLQMHVLPFIPAEKPNLFGQYPFEELDFSRPNQAFFLHVDSILSIIEAEGMLVMLNPVWMDCCRNGWEQIIRDNGTEKCRIYGRYVAEVFSKHKNIMWLHGGDKDPFDLIDHYRLLSMSWYNPVSGEYTKAEGSMDEAKGRMLFETPGNNGGGFNDWVLHLSTRNTPASKASRLN